MRGCGRRLRITDRPDCTFLLPGLLDSSGGRALCPRLPVCAVVQSLTPGAPAAPRVLPAPRDTRGPSTPQTHDLKLQRRGALPRCLLLQLWLCLAPCRRGAMSVAHAVTLGDVTSQGPGARGLIYFAIFKTLGRRLVLVARSRVLGRGLLQGWDLRCCRRGGLLAPGSFKLLMPAGPQLSLAAPGLSLHPLQGSGSVEGSAPSRRAWELASGF